MHEACKSILWVNNEFSCHSALFSSSSLVFNINHPIFKEFTSCKISYQEKFSNDFIFHRNFANKFTHSYRVDFYLMRERKTNRGVESDVIRFNWIVIYCPEGKKIQQIHTPSILQNFQWSFIQVRLVNCCVEEELNGKLSICQMPISCILPSLMDAQSNVGILINPTGSHKYTQFYSFSNFMCGINMIPSNFI